MSDQYSSDETMALVLSTVIGIAFWAMWYYPLAITGWRLRRSAPLWPLTLAPLACALLLFIVLSHWSAERFCWLRLRF